MSNVVRFPLNRRSVPASPISRQEFEKLADLALDIVERIVALLDEADGDGDAEDAGDTEPSLGAPEGHTTQLPWFRGSDRDGELDGPPALR